MLKMTKDASWMIKGKIVSFKGENNYTEEQIGDDKIISDMLRCGYAVKIETENIIETIKKEEQKIIETYENKMIIPEKNKAPKKRAKRSE